MNKWVEVTNENLLIEDSCNIFETVLGTILIIKTNIDGKLRALSGICTHESYVLETGFIQENTIICPLHLSAFDLDTGEAQNPPAELPLEVFNIKAEDGKVWIQKRENQ